MCGGRRRSSRRAPRDGGERIARCGAVAGRRDAWGLPGDRCAADGRAEEDICRKGETASVACIGGAARRQAQSGGGGGRWSLEWLGRHPERGRQTPEKVVSDAARPLLPAGHEGIGLARRRRGWATAPVDAAEGTRGVGGEELRQPVAGRHLKRAARLGRTPVVVVHDLPGRSEHECVCGASVFDRQLPVGGDKEDCQPCSALGSPRPLQTAASYCREWS